MQTRMKEFRARMDMTQAALAEAVGVRRETIVFLEKGKYNPSLRLAWQVARTLGTSIDELFIFGEEDE
jgi:putative transcriptional regulator